MYLTYNDFHHTWEVKNDEGETIYQAKDCRDADVYIEILEERKENEAPIDKYYEYLNDYVRVLGSYGE